MPEELAVIKLWIDQGAKAPTGARPTVEIVVGLPPASVHPVRAVAVSPDKSAVAAGRGNQIHVYDAGSGNYIRTLVDPNLTTPDKKPVKAAHLSLVESLAFSPVNASQAGYHQHRDRKTGKVIELDAQLDDLSPAGIARQESFYKSWQTRLRHDM